MMKDLPEVFRAITDLLERQGIKYAIMGGLVVRIYGIPRPTYDMDVTLSVDEEERDRLLEAIDDLGLEIPDIYRSGWSVRVANMPVIKARLYLPGGGIDVDLFIAESSYQHTLLDRRRRVTTGGLETWIVSPEDLVLLKLMANRTRDRSDVENVLFMQGQLDIDYMSHWADKMSIRDRLEEALRESGHD